MVIEGIIRLKLVNIIRKGREIREDIDYWARYAKGWSGWKVKLASVAPFNEIMKSVEYYLDQATLEVEDLIVELVETEPYEGLHFDVERFERYIDGLLFRWMELRGALEQRILKSHTDWLYRSDDAARDCYGDFLRAADQYNLAPMARFEPITYLEKSYYTVPAIARFFPVPIIAMPLAGIVNIWNWLALTHETGHDVYFNFMGVQEEAEKLVTESVKDTESAIANIWIGWTSEIFADMFGNLLSGPAFFRSLQELLMTLPQNVSTATDYVHPICSIRNVINATILRNMGFVEEADNIEKRWNDIYGKYQEECIYGTQIIDFKKLANPTEKVVKTLLEQTFKSLSDKSLKSFVCYNNTDHDQVLELKDKFMKGEVDRSAPSRLILAAARLGYEADSDRKNCDLVTNASARSFRTTDEDLAIFRKLRPKSTKEMKQYQQKQFNALKEKALKIKGLK
ncbi:MAG: hypothetical protein ACFFBD_08225 [Candidatus Hodarchaeota archaeon]